MDTITVNEAVRITGYTRQQIYNLIRQGRIKVERPAHEYFIHRRSLLAYYEDHRGQKKA